MGHKEDTVAATAMVELIRDLIKQESAKEDDTATCCIMACNPDGSYDITVLPDTITLVRSVKSITPENLKVGDYAYIFKFKNKLNNAVIFAKIGGTGADVRFLTPNAITNEGSGMEGSFASIHYVDQKYDSLGTAAKKDVGVNVGDVPLIGNDGKLPLSIIPISDDQKFGGVLYEYTTGYINYVKPSTDLAQDLGLDPEITVIQLVNSSTDDTSTSPPQYGYATLSGYYFLVKDSGDFFGDTLTSGTKVMSSGSSWQAIAPTEQFLLLAGGTMSGGITMPTASSLWNNDGILFGTSGSAGRITGSNGQHIAICSGGRLYFRINSSSASSDRGFVLRYDDSVKAMYPTKGSGDTNFLDIGTANNPWHYIYVDDVKLTSGETIAVNSSLDSYVPLAGTSDLTGSIVPKSTSTTLSLGSGQYPFNTFYVNNLYNKNGLIVKGDLSNNSVQKFTQYGNGSILYQYDNTSGHSVSIAIPEQAGTFVVKDSNGKATVTTMQAGADNAAYAQYLSGAICLGDNAAPNVTLNFPTTAGTYTFATTSYVQDYVTNNDIEFKGDNHFYAPTVFRKYVKVWDDIAEEGDTDTVRNMLGVTLTDDFDLYLGSVGFVVNDASESVQYNFKFPHLVDGGNGGTWTLATQEWTNSNYVPLIPSTNQQVVIGDASHAFNKIYVDEVRSYGDLELKTGDKYITAICDQFRILTNNNYSARIDADDLTNFRYFSFPDQSGTIALKENVPGSGLPNIRVTSLSKPLADSLASPYFDANETMYLNVVVTGGTLNVGDEICICQRTRSKTNAINDIIGRIRYRYRVVKKYTVTSSDIENHIDTFSIPITNNDDDEYVFSHNNSMSEGPAIRFIRIRRKIDDNHSIFSNIETVRFTYNAYGDQSGHHTLTMI